MSFHVMGKTAFINIDDGAAIPFLSFNLFLEETPCVFACLRVLEQFVGKTIHWIVF